MMRCADIKANLSDIFKNILFNLIGVLFFFISVSPAHCELPGMLSDNNFYPMADAYIYEKNDSTAGSYSELFVGYQDDDNFGNVRSALRFDISAIPQNAAITKAYLFIYAVDEDSPSPFPSIQVYPAPSRWTESALTWAELSDKNAPVFDSSFVPGISGSSPSSFFFDITDVVQSWVNQKENYGLVLQCNSEGFDDYIRIYSRENLLFKPCLNVSYTCSPPSDDSSFPDNSSETATVSGINDSNLPVELAGNMKGTETLLNGATLTHDDKFPDSNSFSGNPPRQEKPIPPEITSPPASRIINPGESVTFFVVSSGTHPFSFQWMKDGQHVIGETFEICTIHSASKKDEGIYSCIVTNEAGSQVSGGAELLINDPPEISRHPEGKVINPGSPAVFSVIASGTLPLSFQWVKDGENIAGETSQQYTIRSAAKKDEGIYSCIVTNEAGSQVSEGAELLINDPPEISRHPEGKVINPGNPAVFSVIASGTLPLSFQWMKDGENIAGETSQQYTIGSTAKKDEGIYSCIVTNEAGSQVSEGAELLVNDPPEISRHPEAQIDNVGTDVSFFAIATGTPPLSFQWLKDGEVIKNETSETITINSVSEINEGFYSCRVTNDGGSIETHAAPLYVIYPPEISKHPESQLKDHGMAASFSVRAAGAPPLSFQWLKDGEVIENETSETITIDSVSETNEGFYSCRVTNDAGSIESHAAPLYVVSPLKITTQPQSQQKQSGQSAAFNITADGTGPFSYQWKKDTIDIPGATANTYTIVSVNKKNEGLYSCEVRNNFSRVLSSEAQLTIIPPVVETISEPTETDIPDFGISDTEPILGNTGNKINSTESSHPPEETIKTEDTVKNEISASSSTNQNDDSNAKARSTGVNLTLKPPAGQGSYVHNGDILICSGTAPPHSVIFSARLVDDQERLIRNVSRSLNIDSKTGKINGSIFVGSFRRADSVHLLVTLKGTNGSRMDIIRSNKLFVDNTYPEISITAPQHLSYHITSPIIIQGTASDSLSGVDSVEISLDDGFSFSHVSSFKNGNWKYEFSPLEMSSEYQIKIRATDHVGLSSISGPLTIKYAARRPKIKDHAKTTEISSTDQSGGKTINVTEDSGICTYRVTDFSNSRFQKTETFRLKEEMAIIVKGYGGNAITIRISAPPSHTVLMELVDYIPENKHKMWKWKLSKTGTFQAALFVDGIQKDDVYFKIIQ